MSHCVDNAWDFPNVDRVRADHRLKIRIKKAQKPRVFVLHAYDSVDEHGVPQGDRQNVDLALRRVTSSDGTTVAWDAVFKLADAGRHYYLKAGGLWEDEEGSESDQDAVWTFHVKTRRQLLQAQLAGQRRQ